MAHQKVGSLSGGERNRTALAWLSASDANLLILDEPTNHLDLWARAALEAALRDFDGSVFLVSHDRYFLNQVCDHLLVVEPNRFRVIEGGYDTYLHLVKAGLARDTARAGAAARGGDKSKVDSRAESADASLASGGKPVKRKRKFPYRKPLDVEAEIHQREARIAQLHEDLANPDVLRDGPRVKAASAELAEIEDLLVQLYEHWEEALELNT